MRHFIPFTIETIKNSLNNVFQNNTKKKRCFFRIFKINKYEMMFF